MGDETRDYQFRCPACGMIITRYRSGKRGRCECNLTFWEYLLGIAMAVALCYVVTRIIEGLPFWPI